jgi:hypothetical protein
MAEASRADGRQGHGGTLLPHDLVPVIAVHLDEAGEYRAVLDPGVPQQLVDLRWASLRAGRLLGRRVRVSTTQAVDPGIAPIVARVTFASGRASTIPRQRQPE